MTTIRKGQIAIAVIGAVASVLVAVIGGSVSASKTIESNLDQIKTETSTKDREAVQRISKLEEAVETIKADNKEIKSDIKEILRIVK